ncbi:MAG TPA: phosphoglycerate kinase, partial [Bacteroidales bacterium]|nr:phosphoglycerate kinase [Bacteroidales bacterium]
MYNLDSYNFKDKKVLLRVDFNVPLSAGTIPTDDTRIRTALPTIQKILSEGGSIIILTHRGRPKGQRSDLRSLKHILPMVEKLTGRNIMFCEDVLSEDTVEIAKNLKPGEIMMLENLRFYQEELEADEEFAKKLSKLGDVYVNDAFGTAHRNHASTATIAKYFPYDKMFGYLFESEMKTLGKLVKDAKSPFTLIIGGDKVTTKISIVEALLPKIDNLLVGGGILYTFAKGKGLEIGDSLLEAEYIDVAKRILKKANENNVNIYLAEDCIIADKHSNDANIEH